jgi:hypothetical protein
VFEELEKKGKKYSLASIDSLVQQSDPCPNRTALVYPTGKLLIFTRHESSQKLFVSI